MKETKLDSKKDLSMKEKFDSKSILPVELSRKSKTDKTDKIGEMDSFK